MTNAQLISHIRSATEPDLRDLHLRSGVPLPTLQKIRYGQTVNPRAETLDRVREVLQAVKAAA